MAAAGGAGVEAGRGAMTTTYTYRCTNGHEMAATRPLTACPACVDGKPCAGELRQVGRKPKVVAA